jgi:hypothetical protein
LAQKTTIEALPYVHDAYMEESCCYDAVPLSQIQHIPGLSSKVTQALWRCEQKKGSVYAAA